MAPWEGLLHWLCYDCAVTGIKLTTLKTEMLSLSTEQVQPGKRQCNVPMCLNPDLEGQPLRTRGWLSPRSQIVELKDRVSLTDPHSRCKTSSSTAPHIPNL